MLAGVSIMAMIALVSILPYLPVGYESAQLGEVGCYVVWALLGVLAGVVAASIATWMHWFGN